MWNSVISNIYKKNITNHANFDSAILHMIIDPGEDQNIDDPVILTGMTTTDFATVFHTA